MENTIEKIQELDKRLCVLETKMTAADSRLNRLFESIEEIRDQLVKHIVDEEKRQNMILGTAIMTLLSVLVTYFLSK